MEQEKFLIIIGSPGAGKGTQANLLSEKLGFYHFQNSKIIGRIIDQAEPGSFVEVDGKKYYFEQQKKLREQGKLWDPPFFTHFLIQKIQELHQEGKEVVFDGTPRTLYEGQRTIPLLKELYGAENMDVIFIEITEDEAIFRNSHRRECKLVRHPVLYSEETAKLTKCQLDGSELIERKDDDPEVIKTRLREFRERTMPLLKFLEEQKLRVHKIDGSPSPVEVFNSILKTLGVK